MTTVSLDVNRKSLGYLLGMQGSFHSLAAIWAGLIVFCGNRLWRPVGDLAKCCSSNVTKTGLAHERNISR